MIWQTLYQVGFIFLLLLLLKYLPLASEYQIYEITKNKKTGRSFSSIDLYKRTFLKSTGPLCSLTELLYFIFLFFFVSILIGLVPLFDNQLFSQIESTYRYKYELLFVSVLLLFVAVMTLLPPHKLLITVGKEYFLTKAMSGLLAAFVVFSMSYAYSTLSFTEVVTYQTTIGRLGLPNWGVLLNPVLFFAYYGTVIFNQKANLTRPHVNLYHESGYLLGMRVMHSIFCEIVFVLHLFLIVTLFFGGYSVPYLDRLIEFNQPFLTAFIQSLVLLAKMLLLIYLSAYIHRIVLLKSDFRFSRQKMLFIFPLMLLGLLFMPVMKYLGS